MKKQKIKIILAIIIIILCKQKINIILAIIIIILCMTLFQNIKKTKGGFQDELIFFKLFSSVQKTNHHQYNFKLEDK